jgi:hypothetical protein
VSNPYLLAVMKALGAFDKSDAKGKAPVATPPRGRPAPRPPRANTRKKPR